MNLKILKHVICTNCPTEVVCTDAPQDEQYCKWCIDLTDDIKSLLPKTRTDCDDCHCLDCGHVVLNPCTCPSSCIKGSLFLPMDSQEAEGKALRNTKDNKFYFERNQ